MVPVFDKPPVFHIGFPKAGSTTLQNRLFSRLSNTCFLGKFMIDDNIETREQATERGVPYLTNKSVKKFYRSFLNKDGVHFDLSDSSQLLQELLNQCNSGNIIFSHEGVLNTLLAYPDVAVKAERIYSLFGKNIRIFINIREQKNLLVSLYRHSPFDPLDIKHGRPLSFEQWFNIEKSKRYFSFLDLLEYDRIVDIYRKYFGLDNVLVLPLELMNKDLENYASRLASFIGADSNEIVSLLQGRAANVGKSTGYNRLRQWRRKIPGNISARRVLPDVMYNAIFNFMKKGMKENIVIPDEINSYFEYKYSNSNKRIASMFDLDLGSIGYRIK